MKCEKMYCTDAVAAEAPVAQEGQYLSILMREIQGSTAKLFVFFGFHARLYGKNFFGSDSVQTKNSG